MASPTHPSFGPTSTASLEDNTVDEWFFAKKGTRSGPHSIEQMRELASSDVVSLDTPCWHRSFGTEWKTFSESGLASAVAPDTGPPPLPMTHVSKGWAYTITLVPLVGAIIETVVATNGGDQGSASFTTLIYFLAQSLLIVADAKALDRAGHRTVGSVGRRPSTWWLLFVPVHLWKRGTYLKQRRRVPFWLYMASIVLGVLVRQPDISGTAFMVGLPSCKGNYASSEVGGLFNTITSVKQAGSTS